MSKNSKRIIDATLDEMRDYILIDVKKELSKLIEDLKPKPKEKWLTRNEVMKILGVSSVTLYHWNKNGILKNQKIGGSVRYRRSDIQKKLDESINS